LCSYAYEISPVVLAFKQFLGITIALLRYIDKFYLFVLQHYKSTSVFFRSARFRFISVWCGAL